MIADTDFDFLFSKWDYFIFFLKIKENKAKGNGKYFNNNFQQRGE